MPPILRTTMESKNWVLTVLSLVFGSIHVMDSVHVIVLNNVYYAIYVIFVFIWYVNICRNKSIFISICRSTLCSHCCYIHRTSSRWNRAHSTVRPMHTLPLDLPHTLLYDIPLNLPFAVPLNLPHTIPLDLPHTIPLDLLLTLPLSIQAGMFY